MIKVFIFSGSGQNQSYELIGSKVHIGRSEENDIQIRDVSVSRRHMEIIEEDGSIFIKDLNSENGTYVNGVQIPPDGYHKINENTPILIGMTLICIGENCLDHIAPFINSMCPALGSSGIEKNTTFLRPLTDLKNSELVNRVKGVLGSSTDVNEIIGRLLDHIMNHFVRVDRVVMILFFGCSNGEVSETVVSRSRLDDGKDDRFSRRVVDRVITTKRPIVIPNVKDEREISFSGTLRLLEIGSVMCAPIMNNDKLVGVIYIDSHENPYGFREDDLNLITELSDITAKSIGPGFTE